MNSLLTADSLSFVCAGLASGSRSAAQPVTVHPIIHHDRNPVIIEFGSGSAAQSIIYRNTVTVVIEFEFSADRSQSANNRWLRRPGPLPDAGAEAVTGPSRRPTGSLSSILSSIGIQSSSPEFASSDPMMMMIRLGDPVYPPSKSSRHRIRFAGPAPVHPKIIHWNRPVVVQFGSETADHLSKSCRHRSRVRGPSLSFIEIQSSSNFAIITVGPLPRREKKKLLVDHF